MGKRKYNHAPYQATKDDTKFVKLYHSMQTSKAWHELKPYSIKLYLGMLDWSNGKIELDYSYTLMNNILPKGTCAKAIKDLIEHGFIDISRAGVFGNRTATTYRLSPRWQNWE